MLLNKTKREQTDFSERAIWSKRKNLSTHSNITSTEKVKSDGVADTVMGTLSLILVKAINIA